MTKAVESADLFSKLYSLNVNDKVESKNGLSYLTWAFAWAEFKKVYPDATYRIERDPQTNLPYFESEYGIMVFTEVTAGGQTYEMWLPVMDGANKAMKRTAWSYFVWDKFKKQQVEKSVAPADMFDINKTIMRCLVKNLAMFGLGLYIYAGEDLPEQSVEDYMKQIDACKTMQDLTTFYNLNVSAFSKYPELKDHAGKKKEELKA